MKYFLLKTKYFLINKWMELYPYNTQNIYGT